MATTTHNRRRVLAAMGALPVAALALPKIAHAQTIDTAAWDRVLAAFHAAEAEDRAFDATYDRITAAYEAGLPSIDTIDWASNVFTFMDRRHVAHGLDVERHYLDYVAGEGRVWNARDPEAVKARARGAADSVLEYRRQLAEHRRASGMDAADDRWAALGERRYEAEWALMDTPAPHLPALLFKLEKLLAVDPDGSTAPWADHAVAQTMADARRLLSGEA